MSSIIERLEKIEESLELRKDLNCPALFECIKEQFKKIDDQNTVLIEMVKAILVKMEEMAKN